jgi:arabinose-5-phosphate isomerase
MSRPARRSRKAPPPIANRDLARARRVLRIEADAIRELGRRLDRQFGVAVDLIAACRGKVVVTGMGKSGQICRKIASTLSSTGTPAFFLHAVEGVHGDSGMVMKGDVVIAVSNSGETEVVQLLPIIKRLNVPLIALTGDAGSTLGAAADVVLDTRVAEEACPMGLAPTASTTATLALGDALAIAVLERKHFQPEDFALLHPGGQLGRRLLRVDELIHTGDEMPLVSVDAGLGELLAEMTAKRLGVTGVVNAAGDLVGVITDGDLRRGLQRSPDLRRQSARTLMTTNPKTIESGALAEKALATMERYSITSLFALRNGTRRPVGIVHMHDLLRAGVV